MIHLFEVAITPILPEEDVPLLGYAFSHDLKVSLRPILGLGQYLAEATATEAEQYSAKILESARRLETQLDALANYTRLCARPIALGSVELGPLLQSASRQQLEKFGWGSPCLDCATDWPAARADRSALQIVFTELLSNALKFSPSGLPPRVTVWGERHGQRVQVIVRDQGLGMHADCLPLLGKPFQKFHAESGVGLGLTLVRRALASLNGQLHCSSAPGQGSRFVVSLEAA